MTIILAVIIIIYQKYIYTKEINEIKKNKKREISKQERVQKKLLLLYQTIEQSQNTVVITDVEGNIEYVNPKFTEITGYTLDEVVGKVCGNREQ